MLSKGEVIPASLQKTNCLETQGVIVSSLNSTGDEISGLYMS